MGWGDEIMVTGEVRRLQQHDPRKVAVVDRNGHVRSNPIWRGNPRIATLGEIASGIDAQTLKNHSGCRPYIKEKTGRRWLYTEWRCTAGEIYLSGDEIALAEAARGCIVVEPMIKAVASPNKQWGWHRWQELVLARPDLPWTQLGPKGMPLLDGVGRVTTRNFREACGALSGAAAAVLPEGGLHHAAAALGVRAVVLFGGMLDPRNTGYDAHINLVEPHPARGDIPASPCGMRAPCPLCAESMARITPARVLAALERLL